ncbi:hypothetical protein EP12_05170 [Alteromonas australica]|nr:hypothetical protein EP12_05170 [Alteromonas australica]
MKKILTVVGARPQFIKAAALSKEIQDSPKLCEFIIHTGQHYDANMSQQFFDQLKIPKPTHVFKSNTFSSSSFIGESVTKIGMAITELKPDCLLVFGDTYSTLAGAVAANAHGVPLAHVEAGLRSFNRNMPEEHNRVVTDHLSDFLFCPSEVATKNLLQENIGKNKTPIVRNVGDIMFDALKLFAPLASPPENIVDLDDFLLVTLHRPVNVDSKRNLSRIVDSINLYASHSKVVWPVHPRTRSRMQEFGITTSPNVITIPPASYFQMLYLTASCTAVMTDSGGLQKEAFFSGKKCFVVRNETEWNELVEINASKLIGDGMGKEQDLTLLLKHSEMPHVLSYSPYGKGETRKIIVSELEIQL